MDLQNNFVYCRYCKHEIHASANTCPSCGADQVINNGKNAIRIAWMSLSSFLLGLFAFFAVLDDSPWDEDTLVGFFFFISVSIILGILSYNNKHESQWLSGFGITLSVLAFSIYLAI